MLILNQVESNDEQKMRKIKAGIMIYDGFGKLSTITNELGEFWTDYKILEDGNDLFDLSLFLIDISHPYEAKECLEKAKEIFTISNNKVGIAAIDHNLAIICSDQGDYEEAIKKYNQSLKIKEELGDKHGIASTLHQLGNVHYLQSNYEEAVKLYNQCLKIKEELGDKRGMQKHCTSLEMFIIFRAITKKQ